MENEEVQGVIDWIVMGVMVGILIVGGLLYFGVISF